MILIWIVSVHSHFLIGRGFKANGLTRTGGSLAESQTNFKKVKNVDLNIKE
jgi:hypothetical protein